jgi:peptidoglycan/xylan/chitin deacetylase (PgdA/CDA1 family)
MIKLKNNTVNIVMYHYVRPLKKSKYPRLKALELKEFYSQIDFFKRNTNIISEQEFNLIIKTKKIPKKPSVLLTFDDGYKDHYDYVFPYLIKNKISGSFYPPQKTIENKMVLDVNKIHFILEKEPNVKKILNLIYTYLKKKHMKLFNNLNLNTIDTSSRFDKKETILIKRLLQHYLPKNIRDRITNDLFINIVKKDLSQFSKELYLNKKELREMYSYGMNFGIHGNYHLWWENQNDHVVQKEIDEPIKFFRNILNKKDKISVCYPYGSFNKKVLSLLKGRNDISFALSTKVNNVNKYNLQKEKLFYPRFDAYDFKK